MQAKTIMVKEPVPHIQYNNANASVSHISYQLPDTADTLKKVDSNGIEQVVISAVPRLTVTLKDID